MHATDADPPSALRVAITGATGFLGGHTALALQAAGHTVTGVVRRPEAGGWLSERGVALRSADLRDEASLRRAFEGCAVVVANAAMSSYTGSLEEMVRTNVSGTEATLRAAAAAGVERVAYISTVGLYETTTRHPMGEDQPRYGPVKRWFAWSHLTTDWRYSVSKGLAEDRAWAVAAELGLRVTVLRPGPIYGSRDPKWTARLLRQHARRVTFAPTLGVPLIHAGDVAACVVAAVERPGCAGRPYNIAGPPVSPYTALRLLRALSGRGPLLIPVPVPLSVRYDTRAAEVALGLRCRSLEAGLREVLEPLPAAPRPGGAVGPNQARQL